MDARRLRKYPVGVLMILSTTMLPAADATGGARAEPGPRRTLEQFQLAPALFVENQGQWQDPSVLYVHDGQFADMAVTDRGLLFLMTARAPGPDTSLDQMATDRRTRRRGRPLVGEGEIQTLRVSASFVGARTVEPVGRERSASVFNYCLGAPAAWRQQVPAYERVVYPGLYEGIDLHVWGRRSHLKYEFHVAPGADYRRIAVRYEGIQGLSTGQDGSLTVDLGGEWGAIRDDSPYLYQEIDGRKVEVAGRFRLLDDRTYSFELATTIDPKHGLVIDPALVWSTYLGGASTDEGKGVAVDGAGDIYVTGTTTSDGWTSGGYDTSFNGGYGDVFVVKLSSDGAHLWSTYLGGASTDEGHGIGVDASGGVYVTGWTDSPGWTAGGFDTTFNGMYDPFVVKLDSGGAHVWSTYLGGNWYDEAYAIAVDALGNAYVTGHTNSDGWTSDGFDTTYNWTDEAFVVRLSSAGAHVWSTYLGGDSQEVGGYGIAVDGSGGVYVTGQTFSSGWTSGGFDTTYNGECDAFVAKLDSGGAYLWSTYLGGGEDDYAYGIAVNASGTVYVTGETWSSGWTSGGFDTSFNGVFDAFVVKLTSSGAHSWSTYLGGGEDDSGYAVAVDASGSAYVTGRTNSSGWTSGGFDTSYNGFGDAFVARLSAGGAPSWSSYLGGSSWDSGGGIAVDGAGDLYLTGETAFAAWASGGFDTTYNGGTTDAFVAKIAGLASTRPVFRFWSPVTKGHFFTISTSERDKLLADPKWTYEQIAFYAYPVGAQPAGTARVFRFWSPVTKAHFFTISTRERDKLIADPNWTYEQIAFYAYPVGAQPAGSARVFRFWSPVTKKHFFTISTRERDKLLADPKWTYEGIAWYAYE